MKEDKNQQKRASNIVTNKQKKNETNKVNGGVFVFTKSLTVGELAKELNINVSDIIKYFFMNKKLVTINQTLDDESIGEVCIQFGYDFKKKKWLLKKILKKRLLMMIQNY